MAGGAGRAGDSTRGEKKRRWRTETVSFFYSSHVFLGDLSGHTTETVPFFYSSHVFKGTCHFQY